MDLFRTAAGDAAGRGISLKVDQMGVFNYALYQNHVPPVRGIAVFNETGVPAEGLALHILSDVHFFAECTIPLPAVPSGKPVTVSDPALMIDGKMLAGLTEETVTAVTVELLKDGESICGCREEMRVLAYDRSRKAVEGVERVTVVYRRTKKYMPADEEELREALAAGVDLVELAAPVEQRDGKLICTVMKLGEPDESGRRSPVPTDETVEIPADVVIAAIGEQVDNTLFIENGISADDKGRVPFMTEIDGLKVYNIGDSLRGPSTVVECIADAQKAADAIIGEEHIMDIPLDAFPTPRQAIENKRTTDPITLTPILSRCLSCDTVCENCVSVCPNRANTVVVMPDGRREILHIDRLCNECGNCKSFCPYNSAPYLDKLTLFEDEESFDVSSQKGFLILDDSRVRVRLDAVADVDLDKPNDLPKDVEALILTVMKNIALYR